MEMPMTYCCYAVCASNLLVWRQNSEYGKNRVYAPTTEAEWQRYYAEMLKEAQIASAQQNLLESPPVIVGLIQHFGHLYSSEITDHLFLS